VPKPEKKTTDLPKKAVNKKVVDKPKKTVNSSVIKEDSAPKKTSTKAVLKTSDKIVKKTSTKKKKVTAAKLVTEEDNLQAVKKYGLKKFIFQLSFKTVYGQTLYISGNHPLLGNGDPEKALPLQYFNEEYWYLVLALPNEQIPVQGINYHYLLKNADGSTSFDWGNDKIIFPLSDQLTETVFLDSWNYAGFYENAFYTEPFEKVLLANSPSTKNLALHKNITHVFKIKAPLLKKDQSICIIGSSKNLGAWNTEKALVLNKKEGDIFYSIALNLAKETFPIAYKYGIYDTVKKQFISYESGDNRVVHDAGALNRLTVLNDGFAHLPNDTWKGAGAAIPVFSLRSESSFGVGEFLDLRLFADWSSQVGLKIIQILPINDTTATHTFTDSYPYAAISAFALHPIYLNLSAIADEVGIKELHKLEKERKHLNELPTVDYVAVSKIKHSFSQGVFKRTKKTVFAKADYIEFYNLNKHWLLPYAVFCYLRDQYGTVDFSKWPAYKHFQWSDIEDLTNETSPAFDEVSYYFFIQYYLDKQLKEATAYAHAKGIIVKGDIAIGVYRHGVDAWQNPALYHLDYQAGAPPDGFAVKGQNWGFPTYNWQRMKQDGFSWWNHRFNQMSYYFDAFRIDHILGFFRIWSIPMHAVEGIMGHFEPSIPVHVNEFHQQHIWFDESRYINPYINEQVLWEVFGYDNELVKSMFLTPIGEGHYALKPAFATQRFVEEHFEHLEKDTHHDKIKQGLYNLISNVILFKVEEGDGQQFHFRFGMEETPSFRYLEAGTREQLKNLYVDYFFRRQDQFWMQEALQKLPSLKRGTNMLVCGEDLGLVPTCVPEVMKQLGLLSLEIQRMPKDPAKEFFHPNDAPYLSVVTPSTHDMSTIRGWWEEDREKIQHFYNHELGQMGEAPMYCEAWINKAIVLQHLYSPAMWSIFQLQDILGIDEKLRRQNPADERINVPADPKHYWCYRMHLSLETLLAAEEFNKEFAGYIKASGRN
jgi:4-alpha-glucanotransferase